MQQRGMVLGWKGNQVQLSFINRLARELPGDSITANYVRLVSEVCWSPVQPTAVSRPHLLAASLEMLQKTGLDSAHPDFASVLAGNQILDGMHPLALRYGGHQFGHWAGQLGDGRAICLGEICCPDGEGLELQLKGAGQTPYSRRGDGRAVLRSSLREYLCSEAMFHLGVPTTRALSLVGTGQPVIRDIFYDGNPSPEPGAVVCRVSPTFLRFGNYEIHAAQGEVELLERLVDFTVRHYFKNLLGQPKTAWFAEICRRTALLMVEWLRVGFVHGVMNTDNMSILGLTIDYGPYGWLDDYDPSFTPNTTDLPRRRYAFANQPQIAQWNLVRLAEALAAILQPEQAGELEGGLELYAQTFNEESAKVTARKFGFTQAHPEVLELAKRAYTLMTKSETDYTLFFRALAQLPRQSEHLESIFYLPLEQRPRDLNQQWQQWLDDFHALHQQHGHEAALLEKRMNLMNPWFIPRNYLAQQAIEAASDGDLGPLEKLMKAARDPYRWPEDSGLQQLAAKRPEWARHKAGCSALSCSS